MYHKPKLILALFFFICAILSILLWINVMNVSAQNYCTGFEEVHSIEIYGDMEHFNLNDNITFDLGYTQDVVEFVTHIKDNYWNNWSDQNQTDIAGYPELRMLFYLGYDGQFDYSAKLYQNLNNPDELIALVWSYARTIHPDVNVAQHPDCGGFVLQWSDIEDLIFKD